MWTKITNGVLQGSALGPFNIYLSDLIIFFNEPHLASYADDNTLCLLKNMDLVLAKLQHDSDSLKVLLHETDNNIFTNVDNFENF